MAKIKEVAVSNSKITKRQQQNLMEICEKDTRTVEELPLANLGKFEHKNEDCQNWVMKH